MDTTYPVHLLQSHIRVSFLSGNNPTQCPDYIGPGLVLPGSSDACFGSSDATFRELSGNVLSEHLVDERIQTTVL